MYDKFEKEAALSTYLVRHNIGATIKCWGDWIEQEGKESLSPYHKGLLTKMWNNASGIESVFSRQIVTQKESTNFVKKITDYYIDGKEEFLYLFKKSYMDTLNSTLPSDLFGDSFLSMVIAFHYLDDKLIKTIERAGKIEEYNKLKIALTQWVKFYKKARIILPEDWIKEMLEERC